jgi:hypothetical protein
LDQWWIYRDGAIVGPVKTDLVIRGLIAGKIPHDARVRADEVSDWAPILSFDDFADATQKTTLLDRPASMSKLEVAKPVLPDDADDRGRFWHAPEWMLLVGELMTGPFSLAEIQKQRPKMGAQVCRLHTFDWLSLQEAFTRGGVAPPPPEPESTDAPMWIVHHDGDEQGPTSLEELAKAHAQGRLADGDVVVKFGATERMALADLFREHGLLRPKLLDRTVVVARNLGADPRVRDHQRAIFFALVAVVAAVLIGVVALVLK